MTTDKKFFWLKLRDTFFQQKEIKKLRAIAGGDTYVIIYLKIQLLSLRNEGVITFEGTERDLAEQLSYEIDENVDNIGVTLRFLHAHDLIEQISEVDFMLPKAVEAIGKEGSSAERVRKHREKHKQLKGSEDNSVTKTLQCNDEMLQGNTEIEKEKEIEIDINISKDIFVNQVVEEWNKLPLPSIKFIKNKRLQMLKARAKEYGEEEVINTIKLIASCSFLLGHNNKTWTADIDWLLKPNNFPKVQEGKYLDNKSIKPIAQKQRDFTPVVDEDYLEKLRSAMNE